MTSAEPSPVERSPEAYSGPALLDVDGAALPVRVALNGRFEPVDGRYHWGGRIAPDEAVADRQRHGSRAITLQVGCRVASPARLAEIDPWGGVRVQGIGTPPWAQPENPSADTRPDEMVAP